MQRLQNSLPIVCLTALLFASSAAPAAELNGIVLDQAGEGVPGITVTLLTNEFAAIQTVSLGEATTDDEGRFRVTVPERWFNSPDTHRQELTLLARSEEHGTGGIVVSRYLPLPIHSLTITLEQWATHPVELVDADGNPVRNVGLKLRALLLPTVLPLNYTQQEGQRQMAPLPVENARDATRTNGDGIAELLLPPIESISSLEADVGDGVTVTWSVVSNTTAVSKEWSRRIEMPELTRLPLRIATDSPEALSNLTLTVGTSPRQSDGPTTTVSHKLDIDANGSATLTTRGDAILFFRPDAPDFPDWRLDRQFLENTSAVDDGGIQLKFRKGITVDGRVVAADGAPVANVNLVVMGGLSLEQLPTDDDGKFEFLAAAGQQLFVSVADRGYRGTPAGPESIITIPPDAESFTIPDIVVTQLRTVSGRVNDGDGRPVADASVFMQWDEPHPQNPSARNERQETLRTDDEGRFRMAGIDPDATLRIAAWNATAASEAVLRLPPAELAALIEIVVSTESLISAIGRVVDQAGAGIPGLRVALRHRTVPPLIDATLPVGADVMELVTDDQGRYAAQNLRPWGEYIAVIRSGTQQEAVSGWRPAGGGANLQLPEIVTSATTEFSGRVVAIDGSPISAATVQLLTSGGQSRATTDDSGRFKIEAVGGRGPLLIAWAEGFSFSGIELSDPSRELSIVLPRPGEAAPPDDGGPQRAPAAFSPDERRALAVKLYESLPQSDPQTRGSALAAVARIDPDYARERLGELTANAPAAMNVRRTLGMAIAGEDPAEALEVVEEFSHEWMKLYYLLQLEPRLDISDADRRELLARILQDGRGVASADHRVISLGLVGERLLDLGDREAGEALLHEGHALARNLAPAAFSGFVRGAFAEELAQVDPDAALALIEPLTEVDEFNRHLTNIAHELAAIDPDRAADCLDLMRETQTAYIVKTRDGAVIRVCYRMVRTDPDRAVALAGTIEDDVMRVRCLGVMADALLTRDALRGDARMLAGELIENAWRILAGLRDRDQSETAWLFPSTIAGLLLPATAELFPEQLSSRVWQSIALRRPMAHSGPYVHSGPTCCSELALLLSEIDPDQCRRVAAWLPDHESGKVVFEYFIQFTRTAAELMATVSPDRMEACLAAIDDESVRNRAALGFIAALSRDGESRRRAICNDLGLWFPDDEDLGPME